MKNFKSLSVYLGAFTGVFFSIFLISFIVIAWTGPSGTPPANNVSAPLHVGIDGQVKQGPLGIEGVLRAYSNFIVDGDLCIDTDCRSAWPTGGITSLSELDINTNKNWAGYRISNVGTPIYSGDVATKGYVDSSGGGGGVTSLSGLSIDTRKDWNGYRISNVGSPYYSSDVATKGYVDSQSGGITSLSQLSINTSKDWSGYRIRNVGTPIYSGDVATKGYVDSQSSNIPYLSCTTRSATCTNYNCSVGCPSGWLATGGGIYDAFGGGIGNLHETWSGTAWHCAANDSNFVCEVRCCRISFR